jgi:hypothetical protein
MPFKRTTFMMKITLPPLPFGAGTGAPPLLPTFYKVVQRFLNKSLLVI